MSEQPDILRALNDPELFGPDFNGESWARWQVFLAAMTGAPMDDAALEIFRQHTGRTVAPSSASHEVELVCGRRSGKSRVLAFIATCLATLRDYRPYLARGEVATIAIIAADRKQARTIFRYITGNLTEIPRLRAMLDGDPSAESITLKNRVVIEIGTASMRGTRGYTFGAVLADEVAFWRADDTSANPDSEILAAIEPGLSTIPGAMLMLASSPYRKQGVLFDNFRRYWGSDDASMLVWRASSREMNPKLNPAKERDAYEKDPQKAASEWGAEFRSDLAEFVRREAVEACVIPGRHELPRASGIRYQAFVDLSGAGSDSMAMSIAHSGQDGTAVLDVVREVKPPCSPKAVVEQFAATLKAYGISSVRGDRYAGEWPREQFRDRGLTYEISDRVKSDIYIEALPMLNSGKVELLDLPRIVSQFCGLERRTSRSGKDSVDHGPGGHDDLVNSVAGALLMARTRAPMRISAEAVKLAQGYRPGPGMFRRPIML